MMKKLKVLLIVIAVICIGVAASYPIRYKMELDSNNSELEDLSSMRRRVLEEQHLDAEPEEPGEPTAEPESGETGDVNAPEARDTAAPEVATDTARPTAEAGQSPADTQVSDETRAPEDTRVPAESQAPVDDQAPVETRSPEGSPTTEDTRAPEDTRLPEVTGTPGIMDLILNDAYISTPTPPVTSTPTPTPSPSPSPTPDRSIRNDADTFKDKKKIRLDEDKILPELREIYELNHDLVGWLYIEDTNIDYPVVQSDEGKFYLTHDFYGRSNANGQIILEDKCDPYTPSYNLVLSGHHMNSGAMFGRLGKYKDKEYWETHKIVEFDTLMARKRYVVFGAFYSADYDEHEEGFRYSADIQYKLDADMWLDEIRANQIYETGVKAEFGDEFITLTTCDHSRRYDGRFVVVARRIREGENFQ